MENNHQSTNKAKLLGIILDVTLTCLPNIDKLKGRLSNTVFLFPHLRNILNIGSLKDAYSGIFHSVLSYGNILCNSTDASEIFELQKKSYVLELLMTTRNPYSSD